MLRFKANDKVREARQTKAMRDAKRAEGRVLKKDEDASARKIWLAKEDHLSGGLCHSD